MNGMVPKHAPMSTLEYLRTHVFCDTPEQEASQLNLGSSSRAAAQTGPEDGPAAYRDFTPDTAPEHELRQFVAPNGRQYGSLALFRDVQGRIVRRDVQFGRNRSTHSYTYDDAGRLVLVKRDGRYTERYAYGPHGERVYDNMKRSYVYDNQLRLVQRRGNGVTVLCYDAAGRVTEKRDGQGITQYGYSPQGALVAVQLPDRRQISYGLDAQGRRVSKAVNNVVVEAYQWLDALRLHSVTNGDGETRFVYAEELGHGPEMQQASWLPVAMQHNGEMYSLAFDQAGALLAVADSTGNAIQQNEIDSFGNDLEVFGLDMQLPYSFGGGLYDRDTGLIHCVHREYYPETGHFMQPDPLGYAAGDVEVYGWCLDDPVNLVDPLGLEGGDEGSAGNKVRRPVKNVTRFPVRDPKAPSVEFDNTEGSVTVYGKNGTYKAPAVSGPHRNGALPTGGYTLVGDVTNLDEKQKDLPSYCDPNNDCWWQILA